MGRVKLRMGDRVTVQGDNRVYEVMGVDSDQADGYALLKLRYSDRKADWYPVSLCQKVEPCNL